MAQRIDDINVKDSDELLRRIWNQEQWINLKKLKEGDLRPSSVAFLDDLNEVSVNVAAETTPEKVLELYPDFGLVSLKAGVPRSQELIVSLTPEDPEPSHRVICLPPEFSGSKRKGLARIMAEASIWIEKPAKYR